MFTRREVVLGGAAALSIPIRYAQAQPADAARDIKRLRSLYETIHAIFSQGAEAVSAEGKLFFVMLNPGVIVDPSLNFETAPTTGDFERRRAFINSIDRLIDANWIYTPRLERLYDLYSDIIKRDRRVGKFSLSKEQEEEIAKAKAVLFADEELTPTSKYKKFQDLRRELAAVVEQIAIKQKNGEDPGAVLDNQLQSLQDDLATFGGEAEINAALSVYNTLNAQRPESWWQELRRKLESSANVYPVTADVRVPKYLFYPSYSQWTKPTTTWFNIGMKSSALDSMEETKKTSLSASGSASGFFWKARANYSKDTQWESSSLSEDIFDLNFDATQVFIDRPWMEGRVFTSPIWDWSKNSPRRSQFKGLLSNGKNPFEGEQMEGYSPVIPVSLILAKNAKVTSDFSSERKTFFAEQISASANFGFGPFSMGGNYNESSTEKYRHLDTEGASIKFTDPQVIGMFVRVLPLGPVSKSDDEYVDLKPEK